MSRRWERRGDGVLPKRQRGRDLFVLGDLGLCALMLCALGPLAGGCTLVDTEANLLAKASVSDDAGHPDVPLVAREAGLPPPAFGGPGSCDATRCDDGLSCTVDACLEGRCHNLLAPGACIIEGRCYRDGEAVGTDTCVQCAPTVSVSQPTFASGATCDDGRAETFADTCLASGCRGFAQLSWARSEQDERALLAGVALVPRSKEIWAVGRYYAGGTHPRGLLVRLDGTQLPPQVLTGARPFTAIHGQLAVGQGGSLRFFGTSPEPGWTKGVVFRQQIGRQNIYGVWSGLAGGVSRHYLAGDAGQLWRCNGDGGANTRCVAQQGLDGRLLRVAAVEGASSDALWALRGDGVKDIFAGAPQSDFFSSAAPRGCHDHPTAVGPCVDAPGTFADLWVSSSDEAWVVGLRGLVMRFDGSSWRRLSIPTLQQPKQGDYDFRGVWADNSLVVIVGERRTQEEWQLVALFYNPRMRRWFPPRVLLAQPDGPTPRSYTHLYDVGGRGAQELYLVGAHWDAARQRQRALIITSLAPTP